MQFTAYMNCIFKVLFTYEPINKSAQKCPATDPQNKTKSGS